MKKNKYIPAFSNPDLDFFIKSFILASVVPYCVMAVWARLLYALGKSYWEYRGEGAFMYAIWGTLSSYFIYLISLILVVVFILLFNKKFMSGDKLKAPTKLGLFALSFVLYLITLYLLTLFM